VCWRWRDEFYNRALRISPLFFDRVVRYRSLGWRMGWFGVPELVESVGWGGWYGRLLGRLLWGVVRD
jgi:hypothetical protein